MGGAQITIEQVAETYRQLSKPDVPAKGAAIAAALNVSYPTAMKYLQLARDAKLIPAKESGTRPRKAKAGRKGAAVPAPDAGVPAVPDAVGADLGVLPAEVRGKLSKAAATFADEVSSTMRIALLQQLQGAGKQLTAVMLSAAHKAHENVGRGICAVCNEKPLKYGQIVCDDCTAAYRRTGKPA